MGAQCQNNQSSPEHGRAEHTCAGEPSWPLASPNRPGTANQPPLDCQSTASPCLPTPTHPAQCCHHFLGHLLPSRQCTRRAVALAAVARLRCHEALHRHLRLSPPPQPHGPCSSSSSSSSGTMSSARQKPGSHATAPASRCLQQQQKRGNKVVASREVGGWACGSTQTAGCKLTAGCCRGLEA